MYCLKCGRETDEDQAFCLDCQKEMEKYPIDPNAVVLLPVRRVTSQKKPVKRRVPPEEQIRLLKRRVHIFACLFLVALIAAICLSVPFFRDYEKRRFQIGQNYTTVKPSTAQTESVAPSE